MNTLFNKTCFSKHRCRSRALKTHSTTGFPESSEGSINLSLWFSMVQKDGNRDAYRTFTQVYAVAEHSWNVLGSDNSNVLWEFPIGCISAFKRTLPEHCIEVDKCRLDHSFIPNGFSIRTEDKTPCSFCITGISSSFLKALVTWGCKCFINFH